jgi:hypothetical protein
LGKEIGGRNQETGSGRYHLFTRFDPDWSGLSWSRSFPVLLASLLFSEGGPRFSEDNPGTAIAADRRVLDPEQITPLQGDAGAERQAAALRMLTARVKGNDRAEMRKDWAGMTNDRAEMRKDWAEMTNDRAEMRKDWAEMKMPPRGATDLAPAAWLLIILLFILERVISYGKTKT